MSVCLSPSSEYSTDVSLVSFPSNKKNKKCFTVHLHNCIQSFPVSVYVAVYSRPKDFLEVKDLLDIIDMLFPRSIAGLAVFFRHFAPSRRWKRRRRLGLVGLEMG